MFSLTLAFAHAVGPVLAAVVERGWFWLQF
jgi:hypothetical protein